MCIIHITLLVIACTVTYVALNTYVTSEKNHFHEMNDDVGMAG